MAARTAFLLGAIAALVAHASAAAGPAAVEARVTAAPVVRAVEPTASGQIGINPVSDLGEQYHLTDLGPEHSAITYQGNTYHYIEGHTKYLSLDTVVTTISNKPTTTTSEVKIVAVTATADAGSVKAGDTGLLFSQDVADALRATADDAIQACGLVPKRKRSPMVVKRLDALSCVIDKAVKASGADGPLDAIGTDAFWESLTADLAAQAPEALEAAIAVLKSQIQKKKALVLFGVIFAAKTIGGSLGGVNIPRLGVGAPSPSTTEEEQEDDQRKCDASKPANEDSPICSAPKCAGREGKCTTGEHRGCACARDGGTFGGGQVADQGWWDEQQQILDDVRAHPTRLGTAAPSCFVNTHGDAFDGKPKAQPASWCVCNMDGTKLIYPTLAGKTASAACAYATAPTATISPKVTAVKTGSVTSCRIATASPLPGAESSAASGRPYCTCNDNRMHNVDTWTEGGKATTGCSATRAKSASSTSTSSGRPDPTGNVYVNIYNDADCIGVRKQIQLNGIGECYSPVKDGSTPDPFKCFALTWLSADAKKNGRLAAFAAPGCWNQNADTIKTYNNLLDIQYDDQIPFDNIGSIGLIEKE